MFQPRLHLAIPFFFSSCILILAIISPTIYRLPSVAAGLHVGGGAVYTLSLYPVLIVINICYFLSLSHDVFDYGVLVLVMALATSGFGNADGNRNGIGGGFWKSESVWLRGPRSVTGSSVDKRALKLERKRIFEIDSSSPLLSFMCHPYNVIFCGSSDRAVSIFLFPYVHKLDDVV